MRARLVPLVLLQLLAIGAVVFPASALAATSATKTISAKLTPAAVSPKSAAKASGLVVVKLDAKAGTACWTISLAGGGKPLSAHIHRGLKGKNGPVVLPLGDVWTKKGCVSAPRKSVAAVAGSPKSYYVDVHTPGKFINGLVRGQLRAGA